MAAVLGKSIQGKAQKKEQRLFVTFRVSSWWKKQAARSYRTDLFAFRLQVEVDFIRSRL